MSHRRIQEQGKGKRGHWAMKTEKEKWSTQGTACRVYETTFLFGT